MTVLITGGAGYIDSHMVLELLDADERVVVLDNLSTGHRWVLAEGVPLIVGDTGDQPLVSRLIREHDVEAIMEAEQHIGLVLTQRDDNPPEQRDQYQRRARAVSRHEDAQASREISLRCEQIPFFDPVTCARIALARSLARIDVPPQGRNLEP